MTKEITIPYGNFGLLERTYPVISEYKSHFLFEDNNDGRLKIANQKGLILLRNRLNAHLPEISEESFQAWVDWVYSLDTGMDNLLDVPIDFSGQAPSGKLKDLM